MDQLTKIKELIEEKQRIKFKVDKAQNHIDVMFKEFKQKTKPHRGLVKEGNRRMKEIEDEIENVAMDVTNSFSKSRKIAE